MWFSIAEFIVAFWFFFHPMILLLTLYWLLFREWPFPRGYKWSADWERMKSFASEALNNLYTENEFSNRKYAEEDYYDDYDGLGSNSGPTIRHPKNRNRAYSGGSERFDNGGG